VIIDGTVVPIDRGSGDRSFYSDKHRRHGMKLQVIADLEGDIAGIWPATRHR
jgi:hypothetical protein